MCPKPCTLHSYKNPSLPTLPISQTLSSPPFPTLSHSPSSYILNFFVLNFLFLFAILFSLFWKLWARPSNQAKPLHLPNGCEHQHQLHLHHLDPIASGKLLFHRVCLIHYFNFKYKILKRHALCYFLSLSILLIILC